MDNDLKEVINALVKFREERDWEQFHNSKDLALALSVEAGELLEVFLWKNAESADKQKIKEELADVLSFAFLLAHKEGLDIKDIILEKIKSNALKYPVDKAKGSSKKYNQL
jgi:NTP pyrophosphatase (non-canonical NTP hydrolase)